MAFFNPKEDVIDIQLTEHGKIMLANGKFRPVYYEFYDDDIVYDTQYGGIQETQKEINSRIKSQVREKTQYSFVRSSSGSASPLDQYRNNFYPLGDSSLIKKTNPSYILTFFNNKISSSYDTIKNTNTGSWANEKIIELEDVEYTIYVDYYKDTGRLISPVQANSIYPDNTILKVRENEIFIDVHELGTDIMKENFELSLVEIGDDGEERQIYFEDVQQEFVIKNNIYVNNMNYQDYITKKNNGFFDNKNYVNSFFEILVDKQIQQEILCKNLPKQEINKLKIVEGYDIECSDRQVNDTLVATSFRIPSEG